jgi:hypothetical protein
MAQNSDAAGAGRRPRAVGTVGVDELSRYIRMMAEEQGE